MPSGESLRPAENPWYHPAAEGPGTMKHIALVALSTVLISGFLVSQEEVATQPGKIPQNATEAEALIKHLEGLKKADPAPDEAALALIDRQLKAGKTMLALFKSQEALKAEPAALTAAVAERETEAKKLREQGGYPTFSHFEKTKENLEAERLKLTELEKKLKQEATTRVGFEAAGKDLGISITKNTTALEAASKALEEAKTKAGAAPDEATRGELFALELEKASLEQRGRLLDAQRSLSIHQERIDASEAQTKLLAEEQTRQKERVLRLTQDLQDLESREGERLLVERAGFKRELEDATEEHKAYWRLKAEIIDLRLEALEAIALDRSWKDRVTTTGDIFDAIQSAERLDEFLTDEDAGRLPLATLRYAATVSEEQLADARTALGEIRMARAAATEARRLKKVRVDGLEIEMAEVRAVATASWNRSIEASNPRQWDVLKDALAKELKATRVELQKLMVGLEKHRAAVDGHEEQVQKNRRLLEEIILWTRGATRINWEAIKQAFTVDLTRSAGPGVIQIAEGWALAGERLVTLEEHRSEALAAAIMLVVLLGVFFVIQRKLPATYSWIEDEDRGPTGRASRLLAAVLRRTVFVFMLALIGVGVPALLNVFDDVLASLAVVFATPFVYRSLRVLLDLLVDPKAPKDRLVQIDESLVRLLHRAGRYALNLSVIFIPAGLLMQIVGFGKDTGNPGFVELWWLIYRSGILLVMLFSLCRPSLIQGLIRGQGAIAKSATALIILVYPLVMLLILFVSALYSLNYDEAALTFTIAGLESAGVLLLAWFIFRSLIRATRPGKDMERRVVREEYDDEGEFLEAGRDLANDRLTRLGLRVLCFLPGLMIAHSFWPESTWSFLGVGMFGQSSINGGEFLGAILSLWITFTLLGHYRATMRFLIMPRTRIDSGVQYTITTLSSYGLLAVGVITCLQILRVEGDQISYILSALALGIGFGLQSIIRNLVSGIILLVERPVKIGDWVEVSGKSGKVDKITIRATTVMTWDGVGVVIPNEDLIGGVLVNASLGRPRLRNDVVVGAAYGSDVPTVKQLILEAASGHGLVLKRPSPEVFFTGFGDSSLDFQVRFWTAMSANRVRVKSDIRASISAIFERNGIEIPFPQRDLNVRSVDAGVIAGARAEALPEPDTVPDDDPVENGDPEDGGAK